MDVSKTSDPIQIKIKMPNPSQEPPVSSKAPNEGLKDMEVLCTSKIKLESQNLEHGVIKDQQLYLNQNPDTKPQSVTSSVLQDLEDMDVLCTFILKIESQKLDHGCIKDE